MKAILAAYLLAAPILAAPIPTAPLAARSKRGISPIEPACAGDVWVTETIYETVGAVSRSTKVSTTSTVTTSTPSTTSTTSTTSATTSATSTSTSTTSTSTSTTSASTTSTLTSTTSASTTSTLTSTTSASTTSTSTPTPTTTSTSTSTSTTSTSTTPTTTSTSTPTTSTSSTTSATSTTSEASAPTSNSTGVSGYSNSLYFTNWGIYGANFQPQEIPASKVTRILYAFADIGSDGTVKSSDSYADVEKHYASDSWNDAGQNAYGCVKQLFRLKKQHRQLKVLLSIGGWTYSSKFAPVAATAAGRQTFADSAVQLMADWGFDGLDIDWEYPKSAAEAQNFVQLLQTCRAALDSYAAQHAPGYHFLITVASPAGPTNYGIMDLAGMDPLVDAWNLMAYDYAGSWDTTAGHQANLYADPAHPENTKFSTDKAVRDYVARGVPAHKIMLGLPLYGRAFEATAGLGQPFTGIGEGSIEKGIWLYKHLPRAGATEAFDSVAQASYSYDATARELVSYDNVYSARNKATYLLDQGLGGAVFWEASGDRNDSSSLVGTLAAALGPLDAGTNLLSYPASRYDNIKGGLE